jgi:predicted PurR-regulated permease PerM
MQTKIIERYFFFGLLLATLIFTFFIFQPFWIVLVLGICFSVVLYPIYEWFKNKRLPDWLSSIITVLLFAIILCGPILGIGALVFNQSQNAYRLVVDNKGAETFMNSINNTVNKVLPESVPFDINEKAEGFITYVSNNIANIFTTTVSAFVSLLLMLLIMFYLLKDGEKWKKEIVLLSPLSDKDDENIIKRFTLSVNAVIKGYLFIAVVQGLLLGTGFWLFDISNGALWGTIAAITSLIPTVGTALVSVPAIIFLFVTGSTGSAIGLLIWAIVVVGMVDNLLTPYIVGTKINISPLLILFSVLGGISLFGPVGILVGPLTVSLLYTLVSIYRNEFNQHQVL